MSYVLANTGNPLGRRGLGRMGFDNAPYNVYPQPRSMTRLNGDLSQTASGAISYRIDPRTGRYNFYRTDIKPRGVFLQNTFQHPAPDTVTALGARVLPIGKSVSGSTLQRGRTSDGPMIALRPGLTLSGLGCNGCGGRCHKKNRRRFMGAVCEPDFPGSCGPQSSGCIIPCGPDVAGATEQSSNAPPPGQTNTSFESANPNLPGVTISPTGIAFSFPPRPTVQQQAPSWWDQKTNVGGMQLSNPVLAAGAVGFAFLLAGMGKGRR